MKKTPWFSGDVKPVRDGAYECKDCKVNHFFRKGMFHWEPDTDEYPVWHLNVNYGGRQAWRGLAKEPK